MLVKWGVMIGVNVMIVCGNMFGEYCMVVVGVVVIKDVLLFVFMVGVFVKCIGWVS